MTLNSQQILLMRRENEARRNPFKYRFLVFFVCLLGYSFIALITLLALALLVAFCGLFYGIILMAARHASLMINAVRVLIPALVAIGAFLAAILRALWVQVEVPHGKYIERGEAIPLFQELDRLRGQMGVPHFHRVLLTNDLNAAVVGRPRLGLFGWQEYSLLIGVPLMAVLSPDQFRAVLAHEMGHISAVQGRFDGWIWRQWRTWYVLLDSLIDGGHRAAVIFVWFFQWYAPLFDRHTFILRRINEIESDRIAAQTVGARAMAEALLTLEIVMRSAHEKFTEPVDRVTAQRWINEALNVRDDLDDVHPSLATRLRSIGQAGEVPAPQTERALTRYLGHRAKSMAASVGIRFHEG